MVKLRSSSNSSVVIANNFIRRVVNAAKIITKESE